MKFYCSRREFKLHKEPRKIGYEPTLWMLKNTPITGAVHCQILTEVSTWLAVVVAIQWLAAGIFGKIGLNQHMDRTRVVRTGRALGALGETHKTNEFGISPFDFIPLTSIGKADQGRV